MNMKRMNLFFAAMLLFSGNVFAEDFMDEELFSSSSEYSYEQLLQGFTSTNRELERMKIKLDSAVLNNEKSDIKNGANLNVSSGNSKIYFDKSKGTYVSVNPSVNMSIPQANGLTINSSVPSKINADGFSVEGTSVQVSADLLNNERINTKISLIESQRNLLIAQRNLTKQQRTVQLDFLKEISVLYENALKVMSYRETYMEKATAFEKVKIDGYAKTSSKYKIAQIEKEASYKDCQKSYRELKSSLNLFSAKCGFEINYLPSEIPQIELLNFSDFPEENFNRIEQAVYNKELGTLKREVNSQWNLQANVGYQYNKKEDENNYTISTGLDTSYKGLTFGFDVAFPLTSSSVPSLGFNIGFNPAAWKNSDINLKAMDLDIKLEDLDLLDARDAYKEACKTYETKAEDLLWESNLLQEQINYYKEVRDDTLRAYKNGIVSESDYIKADNQYLKVKINMLKNTINKYQYNLEVLDCFSAEELSE